VSVVVLRALPDIGFRLFGRLYGHPQQLILVSCGEYYSPKLRFLIATSLRIN